MKCPKCGSTNIQPGATLKTGRIYTCKDCKKVFTEGGEKWEQFNVTDVNNLEVQRSVKKGGLELLLMRYFVMNV